MDKVDIVRKMIEEGNFQRVDGRNETLVIRPNGHLHLCGYYGVKEGSPLFGKSYDEVEARHDDLFGDYIGVHGGLTFSGHLEGHDPRDFWYFGFDCNHSGDIGVAGLFLGHLDPGDEYRNMEYVKREIKQLEGAIERLEARW